MRTMWLWIPLLTGCGGTAGSGNASEDTESTTDDSDPTSPDTTDDGVDRSASLVGTLVDDNNDPLPDIDIRFCRGPECRYSTTDATGAFLFDNTAVDWHSFEAVPGADSGLSTVFFPLIFETDTERTIEVVVPTLDFTHDLSDTPTSLELGEGLLVTMGNDDIEPPLFVDPAESAGGVRLDEALWPPIDREGTLLALWYVVPFDHHATSDSGLPFEIANLWELDDGQILDVWVASYTDSAWQDVGDITVTGDTLTTTAGLPLLSTVALVARD